MNEQRIAGTCVAIQTARGPAGVLLRGPSGAGKSDLALRLIDQGARLIADDFVIVAAEGNECIASAPQTIRGLMEVRGVGIVAVPALASVPLRLIIDLAPSSEVPRLPEPSHEVICGSPLPRLILDPFENSSAAKIRLAIQALNESGPAGVTFPFTKR